MWRCLRYGHKLKKLVYVNKLTNIQFISQCEKSDFWIYRHTSFFDAKFYFPAWSPTVFTRHGSALLFVHSQRMKLGPLWRSFFKPNINHEGNSRRSKEQLNSQEDERCCSLTCRIPSVFVFKNLYFIIQKLYFILENIWAWAAIGTLRRSLKCTNGSRWAERRRTQNLTHKSLLFPCLLVRVLHLLVKDT